MEAQVKRVNYTSVIGIALRREESVDPEKAKPILEALGYADGKHALFQVGGKWPGYQVRDDEARPVAFKTKKQVKAAIQRKAV